LGDAAVDQALNDLSAARPALSTQTDVPSDAISSTLGDSSAPAKKKRTPSSKPRAPKRKDTMDVDNSLKPAAKKNKAAADHPAAMSFTDFINQQTSSSSSSAPAPRKKAAAPKESTAAPGTKAAAPRKKGAAAATSSSAASASDAVAVAKAAFEAALKEQQQKQKSAPAAHTNGKIGAGTLPAAKQTIHMHQGKKSVEVQSTNAFADCMKVIFTDSAFSAQHVQLAALVVVDDKGCMRITPLVGHARASVQFSQ